MVEHLSETELSILAMEKKSWNYPGSKEAAIRRELGLNATQYYLRLNALLDDPRAIREEPALTHRLRARRDG